jgi:tetratricopeptide (TPR) repeat protein
MGEIARQRGDPSRAEAAYREYKRLAEQMVALDPNNMKWRVEEQSAGADLGIILFAQRRFNAAVEQFQQALATIEGLARADPANSDYQTSVADTLAWLADSQMSAGELGQATETRRQQIVLLNRLLARSRGDVAFQQRLIPAHRGLGSLLAVQGQRDAGIGELREAATNGDQMVRLEPGNRQWLDLTASAHLNVGEQLLGDGRSGDAATEINTGCGLADRLIKSNATLAHWRVAQRYCMLLRAKLALQTAGKDQAVRLAQQAVALAQSVHTNEAAADRHAVAKAYRLLGDAEQAAGDAAGARVSWQAAEAALPKGVAERPGEMNEHAVILERLGRDQDAVPLRQNLARIGYRT